MTTTANNTVNTNNAAAKEAEGMFAKAKNTINSFIKACPEQFAQFTEKLNNISNMNDEQAAKELENVYGKMAAQAKECADTIKKIPSLANSLDVKNLEDMSVAFDILAAEIKNADKTSVKIKKAIKLVGTLLYIVGRKVAKFAINAAKKLLVVGIRIAAIAGGFVITVITKGIKAVKKAFRFGKAYKTVKAEEKARKNAPFTVDDLEEEDFEVEC